MVSPTGSALWCQQRRSTPTVAGRCGVVNGLGVAWRKDFGRIGERSGPGIDRSAANRGYFFGVLGCGWLGFVCPPLGCPGFCGFGLSAIGRSPPFPTNYVTPLPRQAAVKFRSGLDAVLAQNSRIPTSS